MKDQCDCQEQTPQAHRGPKRALVNGGAGFTGRHQCERLLEAGHEGICVDNIFTGGRKILDKPPHNDRFDLLKHDITHPLYVEVDQIYNLPCPAFLIHYQRDPQTVRTSVHGAINTLGLAKRLRAQILQVSTSAI